MLMGAPRAKFPPIAKDVLLMQMSSDRDIGRQCDFNAGCYYAADGYDVVVLLTVSYCWRHNAAVTAIQGSASPNHPTQHNSHRTLCTVSSVEDPHSQTSRLRTACRHVHARTLTHRCCCWLQAHAGSLGLCAATVGAVTQELTMREALAVASQKQLVVSPFAMPEAVGTQPPVLWR